MIVEFNPGEMVLKSEDELEAGYLSDLFKKRVSILHEDIPVTEGFNTTSDRQCLVTFTKE